MLSDIIKIQNAKKREAENATLANKINMKILKPEIIYDKIPNKTRLKRWEESYERLLNLQNDEIKIAVLVNCAIDMESVPVASPNSEPREMNPTKVKPTADGLIIDEDTKSETESVDPETGEKDGEEELKRQSADTGAGIILNDYADSISGLSNKGTIEVNDTAGGNAGEYFVPYIGLDEAMHSNKFSMKKRRNIYFYYYFRTDKAADFDRYKELIRIDNSKWTKEDYVSSSRDFERVKDLAFSKVGDIYRLIVSHSHFITLRSIPFYEINSNGKEIYDLQSIYWEIHESFPSLIPHDFENDDTIRKLIEYPDDDSMDDILDKEG